MSDDEETLRKRPVVVHGPETDRQLKAKIRRLADEERARIRAEERQRVHSEFDEPDHTEPRDLISRAELDPNGPARNIDVLSAHVRLNTRAKRDTADKLEQRVAKVEFPVRIMWALFIFAASIAGASLWTAVSYIRTSTADETRAEFRLQAVESVLKSVESALMNATTRIRDTEEAARLTTRLIEELTRRRGTNQRNEP